MTFVLSRLLSRLLWSQGWAAPVLVVAFVFATSWPLMALAEPAGSELVQAGNYWWYFAVTASTVGYGDFSPQTAAGHVVGAYVIAGGIVTLTTVFARLAAALETMKGRRMRGLERVSVSGHVIVLGYRATRTERIVRQLLADGAGPVVLAAAGDVGVHPMPGEPVEFVRGDLTDDAVLRLAGAERARAVLVDVVDDDATLAVAVAVNHLAPGAHVVVTLQDLDRASLVRYVNERFRCVQWHSPRMVTEELVSPGIADVYAELMTEGGASTYSTVVPESAGSPSVDLCRASLRVHHGATLLAVRDRDRLIVNPAGDTSLPCGATIYYVATERLSPQRLEWSLRRQV